MSENAKERFGRELLKRLKRDVDKCVAYHRATPLPPGPLPPQEHWHELARKMLENEAYSVVRDMTRELGGTDEHE